MKVNLLDYLEQFMIQNNWDDEYTKIQSRAIFTTICLVENIDADTAVCDDILNKLYFRAALEELVDFEDFQAYMVELIV